MKYKIYSLFFFARRFYTDNNDVKMEVWGGGEAFQNDTVFLIQIDGYKNKKKR